MSDPVTKRCSKCGEVKALEMFSLERAGKYGHKAQCKTCRRVPPKPHLPDGLKRCSKCGEIKSLEMFSRYGNKDGGRAQCKACEKVYRNANKSRRRSTQRAWRESNKDRANAYKRQWRSQNTDRRIEYDRVYSKTHPDIIHACWHRRRALVAGNGGSYTRDEIQALQTAQNGHCAYCNRTGHTLQIEHIIPVRQGGPSWIWNLCLACRKCNLNKGNKTPEQWTDRWYLREAILS